MLVSRGGHGDESIVWDLYTVSSEGQGDVLYLLTQGGQLFEDVSTYNVS